MDRYRLTASIIVLFVYLLSMYPWQTIVVAGIIIAAYAIVNNIGSSTMIDRNSRTDRRQMALNAASMYLSPYTNIWSNLKLSNKHCSLRLGSHKGLITARDTENPTAYFIIKESTVHSYDELWDMFCYRFSHNTTFDELVQLAERFGAKIKFSDAYEPIKQPTNNSQFSTISHSDRAVDISPIQEKKQETKDLLDVNNASEIELTALPGVSIVMAKKLIKRREELGGFKSVSDVCAFLHLKPHMQTQLEKLICVKKMKGSLKIDRYSERSIDL